MKKVAIVVQRYHESIAGGSEALAWQYAVLLGKAYDVDILTTTALDYITWANVLPAGLEKRQGITTHRFPVTIGRSPYWHQLHERLRQDYDDVRQGAGRTQRAQRRHWSIGLQEECIRHQGPYSDTLLRFLQVHENDYQAIIFVTYLYPTTYFGMFYVRSSRTLLVPTLHNEPIAYLEAYKYMARRARSVLWLTQAERKVGRYLWGELPGRVVALPVSTDMVPPLDLGSPYILYCGRLDPGKGTDQLIDFFIQFKHKTSAKVRLVCIGDNGAGQLRHLDIEYRGFVQAHEKFAFMAGATLCVMPSPYESFSLATLEAMAQRTPVLVNSASAVLAEHVRQSGAGRTYGDYDSFAAALEALLADSAARSEMGALGREYVIAHYTPERVREALMTEVEAY
jgi:glycosyltransferase involved in cell wall biosynthesis